MIPDLVDQVFGSGPEEPPTDEFYPGSRRKLTGKPTPPEFTPDPWRDNFSTKVIHGVEMQMYPVGALANALGVSAQTIRYWTRMGFFPKAPYRLPANMILNGEKVSGRRLYTAPLIEAAVAAFEKRGLLGATQVRWATKYPDLSIEIREAWSHIFNQTTTNRSA